MNSGAPKR